VFPLGIKKAPLERGFFLFSIYGFGRLRLLRNCHMKNTTMTTASTIRDIVMPYNEKNSNLSISASS
jgi:hypothetical protein